VGGEFGEIGGFGCYDVGGREILDMWVLQFLLVAVCLVLWRGDGVVDLLQSSAIWTISFVYLYLLDIIS
jgi:hypothetical protein